MRLAAHACNRVLGGQGWRNPGLGSRSTEGPVSDEVESNWKRHLMLTSALSVHKHANTFLSVYIPYHICTYTKDGEQLIMHLVLSSFQTHWFLFLIYYQWLHLPLIGAHREAMKSWR